MGEGVRRIEYGYGGILSGTMTLIKNGFEVAGTAKTKVFLHDQAEKEAV